MRYRWALGLGLVLLAGVVFFYFSLLFVTPGLLDDQLYWAYPSGRYLTAGLSEGRFPLWVSGLRMGIPFIGDIQMASCYLPSWLLTFALTNGVLSAKAYVWFLVLHLFLAGIFMTMFLGGLGLDRRTRLAGSVSFIFSAFMSLHFVHAGAFFTLVWMPLQLYFLRRLLLEEKWVLNGAAFAAVSAVVFLAGFPQAFMYIFWFSLAYWIFLLFNSNSSLRCNSGEKRNLECGGLTPLSATADNAPAKVAERLQASANSNDWRAFLRKGMRLPVALAVGVALGAVQFLPGAENWYYSQRQELGFDAIADLSLPWYYLIHGVVPNFFGASNGDGSGIPFWGFNKDTIDFRNWHGGAWMYWDFGFYTGQLALIAVIVLAFNIRSLWREMRDGVFFLVSLPIVLWLMLGRYGGLFNLFYHVVPGFSLFRTPARIGCLFDFSAAILAAILMDMLLRGRFRVELRRPIWVLGGLYGILFFGVLVYGSTAFPELKDPRLMQNSLTQIGLSVGLFVLMAVLLVVLKRLGPASPSSVEPQGSHTLNRPRMVGSISVQARPGAGGPPPAKAFACQAVVWSLIILAFLDLYLAFHKFHQGGANPEAYYADRNGLIAQMTQLRAQSGPFRFAQLRDGKISEEVIFPRNIGYMYPGYEALEGYILFNLKDLAAFNTVTNERIRMDIENVGVLANAERDTGRVSLMRYTNSLPRAKFYHQIRAYEDAKALCADLDANGLDYRQAIGVLREDCLKYGISTSAPPTNADAKVIFTPITPEKYQISYQTTAPGIIFISESFYPGWQADSGKYPVIHAFGAFKGIFIPEAGSGVITVKFSPWTFKVGLAISLATLAGIIVAWVWLGRRREA